MKFGFSEGDNVRMLVRCGGENDMLGSPDEEIWLEPGAIGEIQRIEQFAPPQNWAFTISITGKIEGEDRIGKVVNVFDEHDGLPETQFFEAQA